MKPWIFWGEDFWMFDWEFFWKKKKHEKTSKFVLKLPGDSYLQGISGLWGSKLWCLKHHWINRTRLTASSDCTVNHRQTRHLLCPAIMNHINHHINKHHFQAIHPSPSGAPGAKSPKLPTKSSLFQGWKSMTVPRFLPRWEKIRKTGERKTKRQGWPSHTPILG